MTSSPPSTSGQATDPFDALKRRVSFFFGDKRDSRSSVKGFLAELKSYGEAAIVGGMLRDFMMGNYRTFKSDVDLVVDAPDVPALEAFLLSRGGVRNKFGGYALPERWKIDVWPLQRTWAHVHGHREVRVLEDILHTTFFNWDAIIYLVGQRRVVASARYFEEVDGRYLDLNLVPNPNQVGSLIRTMRAAAKHHARLSPALTEYASRRLLECSLPSVMMGEAAAYGDRAVLTPASLSGAAAAIAAAAGAGACCIPFPAPQMPLPSLGEDTSIVDPARPRARNPSRKRPRQATSGSERQIAGFKL